AKPLSLKILPSGNAYSTLRALLAAKMLRIFLSIFVIGFFLEKAGGLNHQPFYVKKRSIQ
ncbi:MAG: hypothetical protein RBR42_13105, partial [Desulfomicrobium sp.]|nr:hypothetical protein [Desulfomicrobium sp.]